MANVRVYELAEEFGVESKVVMATLRELGHAVRSASSRVEAPAVRELAGALGAARQGPAVTVEALAAELDMPVDVLLTEVHRRTAATFRAGDRLPPRLGGRLRLEFAEARRKPPTGPVSARPPEPAPPAPTAAPPHSVPTATPQATPQAPPPAATPQVPPPSPGIRVPSPPDAFPRPAPEPVAGGRAARPGLQGLPPAARERMPEQRSVPSRPGPRPAADPPAGSVLRPQHHEWDPTSRWKPLQSFDPRTVGPYTVLRRIGSGSMGRVFLGQSLAGRLLAIKVVKEELADDPEFRKRFQREVAAARGVNGFYAPPVVDADTTGDIPWLATAYVSAPSLQDLVDACGPLPLDALRWVAAQLVEALRSVHAAAIVHRDLKPSNVLVGVDGLRVIDFGLALAAAVAASKLTVAHTTLGTPAYMSPEQAADARKVTPASDVYALGAVLVFAATGHSPYPGSNPLSVMMRMQGDDPDLSGVPEAFSGVVAQCLRRNPAERPDLGELLARIARDMEPGPDGMYRPSELLPTAAFEFLGLQDV
ncbi:translation initiation factor IF-2 N-terminal domain-containing protein [Streptomyces griseoflavus]|uniref:translation initiation factor IF-2 N-terminal domain-containing protein n=1 Tax=Streptomyces griseoflavus TaxID=35619 RepID=UPI0038040F7C